MKKFRSMIIVGSLCMSIFLGMVTLTPISGVASAAQADFIYVSAGGPYYNYPPGYGGNDTYNIIATQTQAGIGPYIGSAPSVTIYNATMVKVVDAQLMTLIDAALGLYNYSGSCAGLEGSNTVIVSGTNSTTTAISATGTATFFVDTLELKIDVIEPSAVNVQVNADWYWNFNTMIGVQLTQDGAPYVLDPADELRITIWQSGGAKDVDNDTMTVQDASAGLYRYVFNPAFPGVWIVIVNLSVSGTIYTGMDQLMIPYPEDPPFFPEFTVHAQWDNDLMVTAQVTVNGLSYTTNAFNEAYVTIWELDTGIMMVNHQLMTHHNDTVGLYNYSVTSLSSGTVYLVFAEVLVNGEMASGSTVTIREEMVAIPAPPEDWDIKVEAGYVHDPWASGLGITATVTKAGESRPDDGSTPVQVSIYHSDYDTGAFTLVLNNQTMNVLDGPRGMYNYIWTPGLPHYGYYHVIVEVEEWSDWYVGTTSIDVAEWVETIEIIDMKTDIIDIEVNWLQWRLDTTWIDWYEYFDNYTVNVTTMLTNITNKIDNISFSVVIDLTPMENRLTALLNNISGNLSMVDQNVSLMNLQVNANAIQLANIITMLNQMDANQTLIDQMLNEFHTQFKDYRNTWNITMNQIINDLDFQNLTILAVQSSIADFRTDFGNFWNDFNVTIASTVNDWFNTTWNKIDLFEANITAMLNSQNINFSLMESGIVGMLNDQNLNMSRIDQNLTNINASIQQEFQNLYENHTTMRTHISNYWAEWNMTMANIEADLDWLNQTLVVVLNDIGELNATLHAFWDDFNTTWNDYNIGFAAYWQLLNLTIEGVNQTLQDDIGNLATQMTTFESNMNNLLADISGSIADIDQNVTDMRVAMDNHFTVLWNEHNETRVLVGLYWAEWNSTINAIMQDLDYVNMTTISINTALTLFRTNFALFWDDYNSTEAAHSTEVETWFTDTWDMIDAFEANNAAMLLDQNDNLTEIDDQLSTGFQNLYDENRLTRGHVSVYWNEWNTTRDEVQSDLDFINDQLHQLDEAGEDRKGKITMNTILLIIVLISAIFMMLVFRKYIVYSLSKKK